MSVDVGSSARAWARSGVATSVRVEVVAAPWSPRSTTNSAAPIAIHVTSARNANASPIRQERERGTAGLVVPAQPAPGSIAGMAHALRRHQPVADPAQGLDRWPVVRQLLADLGDVDVHRAGLAREIGPPDVLEQRVARQHHARIAGERDQEIELAGSQVEPPVVHRGLPAPRIDAEAADLDGASAAGRRVGPAQDRLDPRHEGSRVERLRDVVVRPELQADDRVDVVRSRREHQHRRVADAPDLAADLEAVELWQHQVEDHERRVVPAEERQRLLAIGRRDDGEPFLLEVQAQQVDDVALVVDDEDGFHGARGYGGGWIGRPITVSGT